MNVNKGLGSVTYIGNPLVSVTGKLTSADQIYYKDGKTQANFNDEFDGKIIGGVNNYYATYSNNYWDSDQDIYTALTWVKIPNEEGIPMPEVNSTNAYLWNYEEFIYADGTSFKTTPTVISVAARSIVSEEYKYMVLPDSAEAPNINSEGWETQSPPTDDTNRHLWRLIITKYSTGEDEWRVELIGVHGTPGIDGTNVEYVYLLSAEKEENGDPKRPAAPVAADNTSADSLNQDSKDLGWKDEPVDVKPNTPYLWMSTRKKEQGSPTWGAYTDPTLWAIYGKSILQIIVKYAIHNDSENHPALDAKEEIDGVEVSVWKDKSPAVNKDKKFLWKYTKIEMTAGDAREEFEMIGTMGEKGVDGADIEYIYTRTKLYGSESDKPLINQNGTGNPLVDNNGVEYSNSIDDFVPKGWFDEPQGVDDEWTCEWYCVRKKAAHNNNVWGEFVGPKIWTIYGKDVISETRYYAINNDPINHPDTNGGEGVEWLTYSPTTTNDNKYLWEKTVTELSGGRESSPSYKLLGVHGDKGMDGSNIEYIYIAVEDWDGTNEGRPQISDYGKINGEGADIPKINFKYNDNIIPNDWDDEPVDTTDKYKYVFTSVRRKAIGSPEWGDFKNPTLWAKYGMDGNDVLEIKRFYTISSSDTDPVDGTEEDWIPEDFEKDTQSTWGRWDTNSVTPTNNQRFIWELIITSYSKLDENYSFAMIGQKGDPGVDGELVEYVYRLSGEDDENGDPIRPELPSTSKGRIPNDDPDDDDGWTEVNHESYYQNTDFIPEGWSDEPLKVTETDKYLWQCTRRKKEQANGNLEWMPWGNLLLWQRYAKDGADGADGSFKSIVFKRAPLTEEEIVNGPENDANTSYNNPIPAGGWTDGIPNGTGIVYSSYSIFNSNGTNSAWSVPVAMVDSADFEVMYSAEANKPEIPNGFNGADGEIYKDENDEDCTWWDVEGIKGVWTDDEINDPIWMATNSRASGSEWGDNWVITRIKGEKGDSPYYAELTNEVDNIGLVYNDVKEDFVAFDDYELSTNVSIFLGSKELKIESLEVSNVDGWTTTKTIGNVVGGTLTFKISKGTTATERTVFNIILSAEGVTRELKFNVIGVKAGQNGETPILYDISVSDNYIVKKKDSSMTPAMISCRVLKTVGNQVEEVDEGYVLTYCIDNSNTSHVYEDSISTRDITNQIYFELKVGDILMDSEVVRVIEEGNDGNGISSVSHSYLISSSSSLNSDIMGGSWQDDIPDVTEEKRFLWRKTVTTYSQEIDDQYTGYDETTPKTTVTYDMVGAAGAPGIDGAGIEWIYTLTAEGRNVYINGPEIPNVDEDGNVNDNKTNGFIPNKWFDDLKDVTKSLPYAWRSQRLFDKNNNRWGDFQDAVIVNKFGHDGEFIDYEYDFAVTSSNSNSPALVTKFVIVGNIAQCYDKDDNYLFDALVVNTEATDAKDSIWADNSPTVTTTLPYLWKRIKMTYVNSLRNKQPETKYEMIGAMGEKGIDGDNVEYAYILRQKFDESSTDANIKRPTKPVGNINTNTTKGQWTDDAMDVSEEWPFEFCSKRKKSAGSNDWDEWSTPFLWSKYGSDGNSIIDIEDWYVTSKDSQNNPDTDAGKNNVDPSYIEDGKVVWQETSPITTETYKYLWKKTIQHFAKDYVDSGTQTDHKTRIVYDMIGIHGQKGIDGDSVDYIFMLSDLSTKPAAPSDIKVPIETNTGYENGSLNVNGNVWFDDIKEPTETLPYLFVAEAKKTNGVWSNYGNVTAWNVYNNGLIETKSAYMIYNSSNQTQITSDIIAAFNTGLVNGFPVLPSTPVRGTWYSASPATTQDDLYLWKGTYERYARPMTGVTNSMDDSTVIKFECLGVGGIDGKDGVGRDGKEYDFAYIRTWDDDEGVPSSNGKPASATGNINWNWPTGDITSNNSADIIEGKVSNWTDDKQGISELWKCEYEIRRVKENGNWSPWGNFVKLDDSGDGYYIASLVSRYGTDGVGVSTSAARFKIMDKAGTPDANLDFNNDPDNTYEQYLQWLANNGWVETATDNNDKYIYEVQITKYTNGVYTIYGPVLKSSPGEPGATGRSIVRIEEYYSTNNSKTQAPTQWYIDRSIYTDNTVSDNTAGALDAMPPLSGTNKYLWNKERVVYDKAIDGKIYDEINAQIVGNYAVGIKEIKKWYKISNDNKYQPDYPDAPQEIWVDVDGWTIISGDSDTGDGSTKIPIPKKKVTRQCSENWEKNSPAVTSEMPYLWEKSIIYYEDGTNSVTQYNLLGSKGVDSSTEEYIYYASDKEITEWTKSGKNPTHPAYIMAGLSAGKPVNNVFENFENVLDGWVPNDWYDDNPGITSTNKYIYISKRTKAYQNLGLIDKVSPLTNDPTVTPKPGELKNNITPYVHFWGPWSDPVLHEKTGEDGRGIKAIKEYYANYTQPTIHNNHKPSITNNVTVTIPDISPKTSNGINYASESKWKLSSEGIPQINDNYPHLINFEVIEYDDGTKSITEPIVIGYKGSDGSSFSIDNRNAVVAVDSNGNILTNQTIKTNLSFMRGSTQISLNNYNVTAQLKKNDGTTNAPINKNGDVEATLAPNSILGGLDIDSNNTYVRYDISKGTNKSKCADTIIIIIKDTNGVTIANTMVNITYLESGDPGPAGDAGKMAYPQGSWSNDVEYKQTSNSTPYVYHDGKYYVLVTSSNKGTEPGTNNAKSIWEEFESFKAIYTEFLTANYAKLGSENGTVIYDNFMFSQVGKDSSGNETRFEISEVERYPVFKKENEDEPSTLTGDFIPNTFIDYYKGSISCNKLSEQYENFYLWEYNNPGNDVVNTHYMDLNRAHNILIQPRLERVIENGSTNYWRGHPGVIVLPDYVSDNGFNEDGTHICITYANGGSPGGHLLSQFALNDITSGGRNIIYGNGPTTEGYVLVCADSRFFVEDYTVSNSYVQDSYGDLIYRFSNINDFSNSFMWNGYNSKFILLCPGSTLKLRSCIINANLTGDESINQRCWIVENASDFDSIPATLDIYPYEDNRSKHCIMYADINAGASKGNFLILGAGKTEAEVAYSSTSDATQAPPTFDGSNSKTKKICKSVFCSERAGTILKMSENGYYNGDYENPTKIILNANITTNKTSSSKNYSYSDPVSDNVSTYISDLGYLGRTSYYEDMDF